ncbi:hypothetical protein GIY23_02490 [Allosaccharopolyspora coralli]|uniref:Uncharacterized protein n=1 Tax=Allosaccharopolyspora coralli TaxID=2665642 RepID=A0A5Q3Q266_9PSEU|nr:hypothetical protein [Allosaccharopolyspora coralli]QGK68572.1 hypothetical protein GIY23_02490 [Allosaccharopolyspora coralli]
MDEASQSTATHVALILFAAGLLAVVAIFVLFAAGFSDLPVWLNLAALLAPAGLAVGLVSMLVRSRRRTRAD